MTSAGASRLRRSSFRVRGWPTFVDNPGLVGKGGVEPPRPFGHTDLNRARLPFRHLPWRATTLAAERRSPAGGWLVAPSMSILVRGVAGYRRVGDARPGYDHRWYSGRP